MCGVVGFLQLDATQPNRAELAQIMAERLLHRGPGDAAGIALVHRRLSFLGLSPAG